MDHLTICSTISLTKMLLNNWCNVTFSMEFPAASRWHEIILSNRNDHGTWPDQLPSWITRQVLYLSPITERHCLVPQVSTFMMIGVTLLVWRWDQWGSSPCQNSQNLDQFLLRDLQLYHAPYGLDRNGPILANSDEFNIPGVKKHNTQSSRFLRI